MAPLGLGVAGLWLSNAVAALEGGSYDGCMLVGTKTFGAQLGAAAACSKLVV
jgi:hypothetical protein